MAKPPALRRAPKRQGKLTGHVSIQHRKRDGTFVTKKEGIQTRVIPTNGGLGEAGLSMGLTIPGPEKSYMAARIDAWCTLPSGAEDDDIRATYSRASGLVQEQIEKDAAVVREFFDS